MGLTASQRDWLALSMVPGIGTTYFIRLLARFGSPTSVLQATEASLREIVGPKLSQRIRQYSNAAHCFAQEKAMLDYQATLVTMDDNRYPTRLAEIYDPPLSLFTRGTLPGPDSPAVAIVGTRNPSQYGLHMAGLLASELAARGITVVSGLAEGIDSAAHQGALRVQGPTIAVLGCGVDVVYPASNAKLMHDIVNQGGCILSQYPMGVKPGRGHFPQRNRIISGISLGTIIIEAPPGSGSLITARFAAEQGREVFAVPGEVGHRNSKGPHALIREGAKLVENVDDILVELDIPVEYQIGVNLGEFNQVLSNPNLQMDAAIDEPPAHSEDTAASVAVSANVSRVIQNRNLSQSTRKSSAVVPKRTCEIQHDKVERPNVAVTPTERDILSVLHSDGSYVDEIALACRIPLSEALGSLTMLELKGLVQQFSGKRFVPR